MITQQPKPSKPGCSTERVETKWLMDEISLFNVPVKRRKFPKEASNLLREVLD